MAKKKKRPFYGKTCPKCNATQIPPRKMECECGHKFTLKSKTPPTRKKQVAKPQSLIATLKNEAANLKGEAAKIQAKLDGVESLLDQYRTKLG